MPYFEEVIKFDNGFYLDMRKIVLMDGPTLSRIGVTRREDVALWEEAIETVKRERTKVICTPLHFLTMFH